MPEQSIPDLTNLSSATDTVLMPSADAIRQRGERRTRRTAAVSGIALVALFASIALGAQVFPGTDGASPFASATSSAAPVTGHVKPSVFLRQPDLPADAQTRIEPQQDGTLALGIRPCFSYPSDGLRAATGALSGTYGTSPDNRFVTEVVTQFRPGGAAQFMTELRQHLAQCQGQVRESDPQWTLKASGFEGPDSVRTHRSFAGRALTVGQPRNMEAWVEFVRKGDYVVAVQVSGLVALSADLQSETRDLTRKALTRIP
ncbi:hypothetical protein [Longispora albida]|uniref:hypothetical protein n=1 Tax=Longispora albida TaxID=203523 RepID=UPI000362B5E4|nr:hypothetical protein [Longispora albida]